MHNFKLRPRINPELEMIDYSERVEEVAQVLSHEYAVEDRAAVEILLAARLDCGLPYPWLIVETPYYRLDPGAAWFAQIYQDAYPLPLLRTMRPRRSNVEIQDMLRERERARLFIEPNWELPMTTAYQFRMWPYLLQECVRLRTPYPRTLLVEQRAALLLKQAVDRALDSRFREGKAEPAQPPRSLPYWCELLQRLAPSLRDWDCLLTNLCALAGRRAYLFNRHVDSTDWEAISRVMRDSIPVWSAEIVGHFGARGKLRSLGGKYSRKLLLSELKRLLQDGVVYGYKGHWLIRDFENRGQDFIALIRGENICCS